MGSETTNKQAKLDSVEDVKATLDKMKQWEPIIQKASQRFDIAADDIRAIIGVESHARADARAGGAKSASGLMQVTAGTWSDMQKKHTDLARFDFASNWNKPEVNIMFGTATLAAKREAMKKFGIDTSGPNFAKLAITAYNGGEGVVKLAHQHAIAAGSKKPEEDCLKFEHLSYAVDNTRDQIWKYYMPGNGGGKRNKSGSREEAVRHKTNEIMKYPSRVESYLAVERGTTRTDRKTETKPETKPEPKPETKPETRPETTETKTGGGLIAGSVGKGGTNKAADVNAVQKALAARGVDPGAIDSRVGPRTIGAIRRFQRRFMKWPDGLVEAGKKTEAALTGAVMPQKPDTKKTEARQDTQRKTDDQKRKPENKTENTSDTETSRDGAAQMARLVSVARSVRGKRPLGKCYRAVKHHIDDAGGYGNFKNIYNDKRFQPQGEARNFAEVVDRNPAKFGLEKLGMTNPYDAPEGSLVVVAAGSPGTRHPTAGDITVKGPGDEFYNDGSMGYKGRAAWPPKRGGMLGVYKPK